MRRDRSWQRLRFCQAGCRDGQCWMTSVWLLLRETDGRRSRLASGCHARVARTVTLPPGWLAGEKLTVTLHRPASIVPRPGVAAATNWLVTLAALALALFTTA